MIIVPVLTPVTVIKETQLFECKSCKSIKTLNTYYFNFFFLIPQLKFKTKDILECGNHQQHIWNGPVTDTLTGSNLPGYGYRLFPVLFGFFLILHKFILKKYLPNKNLLATLARYKNLIKLFTLLFIIAVFFIMTYLFLTIRDKLEQSITPQMAEEMKISAVDTIQNNKYLNKILKKIMQYYEQKE